MTLNNQFIETRCSGVSLHWDTVKTKICILWWRIFSEPRMNVSKTPCHRKLQLKFILIVVKMVLISGYLHGGDCWERSLTILYAAAFGNALGFASVWLSLQGRNLKQTVFYLHILPESCQEMLLQLWGSGAASLVLVPLSLQGACLLQPWCALRAGQTRGGTGGFTKACSAPGSYRWGLEAVWLAVMCLVSWLLSPQGEILAVQWCCRARHGGAVGPGQGSQLVKAEIFRFCMGVASCRRLNSCWWCCFVTVVCGGAMQERSWRAKKCFKIVTAFLSCFAERLLFCLD